MSCAVSQHRYLLQSWSRQKQEPRVLVQAVQENVICCKWVLLPFSPHWLCANLLPFSPDFICLHSPARGNSLRQIPKGENLGQEQRGEDCEWGEGKLR